MRLHSVPGVVGKPLSPLEARAHGAASISAKGQARASSSADSAVRVTSPQPAVRASRGVEDFLKLCAGSGVRTLLAAEGAKTDRKSVLTGEPLVSKPGGFIAAPSVTGPDYAFVWDRDGAICARALVQGYVAANDPAERACAFKGLADYVTFSHDHHVRAQQAAPFQEGKLVVAPGFEWAQQFMRKEGWTGLGDTRVSLDGSFDPFGWPRPQNDGQALRALAMIEIVRALKSETSPEAAVVRDDALYCLRCDLDYVVRTWPDISFDLWEETYAAKHYYTREAQCAALHDAVAFVRSGEDGGYLRDRVEAYAKAAKGIDDERYQFWNGSFIEASRGVTNREASSPKQNDLDASVVLAAIHSGRIDSRVLATARVCELRDKERYPVNGDVSTKLGTAIGRYVGDVYQGGGAFYMLTAGFAELHYNVAESIGANGVDIDHDNREFIASACPEALRGKIKAGVSFAPGSAEAVKIAKALLDKGDSFVRRVAKHAVVDTDAKGDLRVRMAEQLDGSTGADRSAPDLTWSSAAMLTAATARSRAVAAKPRFPFNYTVNDVLTDSAKAKAFVEDYFDHEAPFFKIARDPKNGLTYDGVDLDRVTREVIGPRRITAPSKECSDVAVIVKILSGDPLALRLVEKGVDPHAQAVHILTQKIDSYERFANDYPGYGGFMPWIKIWEDGSVTPADAHWLHAVPSLDNGEWVFTLIAVERMLREKGETALADRYAGYNAKLRESVRRVFFDEKENSVRTQASIPDIRDPNPEYSTDADAYIRGPHGVYEGAMILHYMAMYAQPPLSEAQIDAMWAQTKLERVETPYGTMNRGFWFSSHEVWEDLIMPKRDQKGWSDLFRIREKVRTHLTKGPGEFASINAPDSGRQDQAGPPYAGDTGPSQDVALEHVTPYQFYAIYGVYPLLLEQSDKPDQREGLAWLLNSLRARNAVTSIGGGESVMFDGSEAAPLKTADGSFLNWIALMGGLANELRPQLQADGTYERYQETLRKEFDETFKEPLNEPVGFAPPSVAVPWVAPRVPGTVLALRNAQAGETKGS